MPKGWSSSSLDGTSRSFFGSFVTAWVRKRAARERSWPTRMGERLGITGTGGAGKSTLAGRLVSCFRSAGHRVGLIAVDPSSPISGGAVLGDRIRMMRHACDPDVVIRSMASRGRLGGLSAATASAARIMKAAGCHPVLIETVGVGQAEFDIVRLADLTMLVMAPGLGDDIQAMKAGLLELTDMLVVNKGDLAGADILMREMEPIAHDAS